jgi:hypothetical protein
VFFFSFFFFPFFFSSFFFFSFFLLISQSKYWAPNNTLSAVPPQCEGKDKCPLGIEHPPNGFEEMSLGCSKCALEASGMALEDFECEDELDDADDYY